MYLKIIDPYMRIYVPMKLSIKIMANQAASKVNVYTSCYV